ncbi:MAG TPA: ribonuclease D [Xanthomonadaceae bacterium]|nr:ribonuclease D [Xanthomonadaceae bacterium]
MSLPDPAPHASRWIDNPAAFTAGIAAALAGARPARIGLDTEFIRERTYWPVLALVQIAVGEEILLVDPTAPGMAAALAPLLGDESVTKVMHSAGEDLVALKRACGVLPVPLFDTQVAATLAGIGGGMGYQKLVEHVTGVALAKGETRSDWLRRPLSASQLDYAADDVRHLFALHDALEPELRHLDRLPWHAADCARMLASASDDEGDRWPHLALRGAQYLDAPGQARLLRLLRWRETQARSSNRPRSWILDNDLAVALARTPPSGQAALQTVLDSTPKAPRSLGAALWQALATPLPDEADLPLARADDRDKTRLRALQDAVAARSAELGLPDGVLASRRGLQALLGTTLAGEPQWPAALEGWRRAELEPVLAPLLAQAPVDR